MSSSHVFSSFERIQVIGRWKNRLRKRVPELTSVRDERVKILVNSCIKKEEKMRFSGGGMVFQILEIRSKTTNVTEINRKVLEAVSRHSTTIVAAVADFFLFHLLHLYI